MNINFNIDANATFVPDPNNSGNSEKLRKFRKKEKLAKLAKLPKEHCRPTHHTACKAKSERQIKFGRAHS